MWETGRVHSHTAMTGDRDKSSAEKHPQMRGEGLDLHHLRPFCLGMVDRHLTGGELSSSLLRHQIRS